MKHIVPAYYPAFRCIAARCRHNCCIGWEIDIDDKTAAYYQTVSGDIGARLQTSVTQTDGVASFVLTADERCPFLNRDGLCDIICALGEQSLCQICADHPRFRGYFSDRTEIGLGLCCEEAARVVLTAQSDELITLEEDDEDDCLSAEERALLSKRDVLFAIAHDRTKSIRERERDILAYVNRPARSGEELYRCLAPLERLEEDWSEVLLPLADTPDAEPPAALETAFERLLVYFLFRHLSDALEDDRFAARAAFAAHSVKALRLLCAAHGNTLDTLMDLARRYSSEIEYSDENLDTLLDAF